MIQTVTREQYEQAAKWTWSRWDTYMDNFQVEPTWIEQSERFWYVRDIRLGTNKGCEYVVVDPISNTIQPAFDHERFASLLSNVLDRKIEPLHLPIEKYRD